MLARAAVAVAAGADLVVEGAVHLVVAQGFRLVCNTGEGRVAEAFLHCFRDERRADLLRCERISRTLSCSVPKMLAKYEAMTGAYYFGCGKNGEV